MIIRMHVRITVLSERNLIDMNPSIVEYIRLASQFSFIFPLILYFQRPLSFPIQNHVVAGLIIISGLTDFISLYIGSPILFNAYELLQFGLITWFFFELIYKKRYKLIALIGIAIYLVVLALSVLQYGLHHSYTTLWTIGPFIILVHSLFYVFNIPRMVVDRYLDTNLLSNMIFNASMFIYSLVALIIFILLDPVLSIKDVNLFKGFWSIHNAFNVIKNLGFAFAFYYTGKRHIYMTFQELERLTKKQEQERGEN